MKRFLKATAAVGLGLALTAPMALAQPAPPGGGQHDDHAAVQHDVTHTTTVQHQTTVQHHTSVTHGNSIVQNGHLTGTPGYNHSPVAGNAHPSGYDDQRPPVEHQTVVTGHTWHRGDRYTGSRQVVTNWSAYHAQRPPSGYEYVRDGNNLVLIAVASGVVASVLANALYQ